MAAVTWTLQKRGRLRPRVELVDEAGATVARIVREERIRPVRAGSGVDPEGRTWRVTGRPDRLLITCDDEPRATVVGGILEVDGHRYGWRMREDGSRTARVASATGRPGSLRIAPGDAGSWATIDLDDALPCAFGVVVAACTRLLQIADDVEDGTLQVRAGAAAGPDDDGRSDDATTGRNATDDGRATDDRPEGEHGPHGDPADALPPRWALFVEGRRSPRLLLSDGGADAMAELHVRGGPPGSLGRAVERDGRRWLAELDGGTVTVSCAGRVFARAEGDELVVGGRTLPWQASLTGERTVVATDPDGSPLLLIAPGPEDGPWATVAFDDALPSPMAATLASLFVLLRVDALGRRA